MDAELLVLAALVLYTVTDSAPQAATAKAPPPPKKEKSWSDYLNGCLKVGVTGVGIGVMGGAAGAAAGGAIGCALGAAIVATE